MGEVRRAKEKEQMQEAFEQMWEELYEWRAKHPGASFDEMGEQVTPRRRKLMGRLLAQMASQQGDGEVVEGLACPECGQLMINKGKPKRTVVHLEGESEIERAYYYCADCESGLFPPG